MTNLQSLLQSVSALFIETANAESFTGARQQFLESFMDRGLISQEQYLEAIHDPEKCINGEAAFKISTAGPELQNNQLVKHFSRPPVPRSGKLEGSPQRPRAEHVGSGTHVLVTMDNVMYWRISRFLVKRQ